MEEKGWEEGEEEHLRHQQLLLAPDISLRRWEPFSDVQE